MRKKVRLIKFVLVGAAVLELSKLHMFKFHYNYIKKTFGDTDSFFFEIKTKDLPSQFWEDKHLFDFRRTTMRGILIQPTRRSLVSSRMRRKASR